MAPRSTRNKIIEQGKKIKKEYALILGHFKFMDDLADGQSDYINNHMPQIFVMIEGCKQVVERFLDGL